MAIDNEARQAVLVYLLDFSLSSLRTVVASKKKKACQAGVDVDAGNRFVN
jgi:hypothetical protein